MDTAIRSTRAELARWRDRGYDDSANGLPANPPTQSQARTAYFQGYRGQKLAAENGDGNISAQRHRRPLLG